MRRIFVFFLLILFAAQMAWAHRVTVFAYGEDDHIVAEGGFAGGNPALNCAVEVHDAANGDLLTSGTTGEDGVFRFPVSEAMLQAASGLNIVIEAGEGHRGEWFLEPEEYGARSAPVEVSEAVSGESAKASDKSANLSEKQLQQVVEKAVERALDAKLAPIKRRLLQDSGPSASDIVGGIGYLVGLAGLAAWARSRRERSR